MLAPDEGRMGSVVHLDVNNCDDGNGDDFLAKTKHKHLLLWQPSICYFLFL